LVWGKFMIKFRCHNCDKKIGVPENYATKMIKCPQCANPTIVPGVIYEEPAIEQIPLADESTSASEDQSRQDGFPTLTPQTEQDDWTDDMFETAPEAEAEAVDQERNCPQCGTEVPDDSEFCVNCGREVPLPKTTENDNLPQKKGLIGAMPAGKSFGIDVLRLMSPVRSLDDGISFFFLVILSAFVGIDFFGPSFYGGVFITIARLMILGIIYTFLFDVLLVTANGDDELPKFEMPTSSWDLVRPYFQMIVSYFYALLPFIACFIIGIWSVIAAADSMNESDFLDVPVGQQYEMLDPGNEPIDTEEFHSDMEEPVRENEILQDDSEVFYEEPDDSVFENDESYGSNNIIKQNLDKFATAAFGFFALTIFLFFAGLFFWPMIVMNIVLGDRFVINPAKVAMNVLRTFMPYLICCIAMYLTFLMFYLTNVTFAIKELSGDSLAPLLGAITAIIGGLCVQIYNMRLLGLLYRYYGEKLDW